MVLLDTDVASAFAKVEKGIEEKDRRDLSTIKQNLQRG